MSLSCIVRPSGCIFVTFTVLLMLLLVPPIRGKDIVPQPTWTCPLPSDNDDMTHFILRSWVTRGACIRTPSKHSGETCEDVLTGILGGLVQLRSAEYAGAASVLSLLPTIGALLGTPTSEIWRLKSIVPFGGILAMTLSFGGALMPVRVEDYETSESTQNAAMGSIISLRKQFTSNRKDEETIDQKLDRLSDKVRERIDQHSSVRLPKPSLILGMGVMIWLGIMAQVAMAVVEQGGVVNWWCSSRWWMHLWYFAVTFTAFTEDRVHRPFIQTYKLFVSSLPYDVETSGGQTITDYFSNNTPSENVALALKQPKTLRPASLTVFGSRLRTRSRNSVMVIVSIAGQNKGDQIWRLLSKSLSVGVFVAGTAIFASVTLLSLIMAIVVLTLTLAAGIFGRAIAGWVVAHVSKTEPMIHVISATEQEAYQAITKILSLRSNDGTHFQVEINGQVFINEQRVASRSRLIVATLGVLAEPYDVTRVHQSNMITPVGSMSLSAISPQLTHQSMAGVASPFLPAGADPMLPLTRDRGLANSVTPQRVRTQSTDSTTGPHQIPRRPLSSAR